MDMDELKEAIIEAVPDHKLFKILECPICYDLPQPPVLQCASGHIICSECRKRVDRCGLCNKNFTKTRNFVAEDLVNALHFNCKYKDQGCKESFTGATMRRHLEEDCLYRPILCTDSRLIACNNKPIPIQSFIEHLKAIHGAEGSDTEQLAYKKIERSGLKKSAPWVLYYMKYDGKYFLKHTRTDENTIYWWISILGTPEEAKNYTATISIFSKENPFGDPHASFVTVVHSIRDKFEDIKIKGQYAAVPKSYIFPLASTFYSKTDSSEKLSWKMEFRIRNFGKGNKSDLDAFNFHDSE